MKTQQRTEREKDAGNIYRYQIRMEEGTGGKTADTNHRGHIWEVKLNVIHMMRDYQKKTENQH